MARRDKEQKLGNAAPATAALSTSAPSGTVNSSAHGPEEPRISGDAVKKLRQKIQDGMEKIKSHDQGKKDRVVRAKAGNSKSTPLVVNGPSKKDKKKDKNRHATEAKGAGQKAGQEQQVNQDAVEGNANNRLSRNDREKKPDKNSISDEVLLKEILSMGGTKEDLHLVKEVESDSDEEAAMIGNKASASEKGLREDLQKFFKELGLDAEKASKNAIIEDNALEVDEQSGEEKGGKDQDDGAEDEDEEVVHHPKRIKEKAKTNPDGDVAMAEASTPLLVNRSMQTHWVRGKLLFEPRPDWHAAELPPLTPPTSPTPDAIISLHSRAKKLLQEENDLYSSTQLTKSTDRQFLSTVMSSGTLSDKISALTLICQESPLHTIKSLETLLGLAKKKSRSQAIATMGSIKDLFGAGVVLPPERKLKAFAKQPGLGSKGVTDLHLMIWAYEDWLKVFYFEVLKVLEGLCSDQLEYARSHAVGYVFELLKDKPEQEANLLRLLVNKLGDKDKKVASKVSFLLLQLQVAHPAMKSIVINSIQSEALFRPGNPLHAKYYAIITLNQTVLSSREPDVANKLLDVYFDVFTGLLRKTLAPIPQPHSNGKEKQIGKLSKKAKKKLELAAKRNQADEEINAKLISAVLTGVNRAFPFSRIDDDRFQTHIDTLFKITHSGNFNTSIQALMLIYQVTSSKQAISDRFYRTLYEALLDQRLLTSSKQAMFLNLLFKALKADTNLKRVKAFVKRLVQICTLHQPAFICGVFYLLSELESSAPSLRTLLNTPEAPDEDEEIFRDVLEDNGDENPVQKEPKHSPREFYDGRKRDPLFANADKTCLWEVIPFTSHFHPSVSLFASAYLTKSRMPPKPDLSLHTLSHFLDRFVFKNPKATAAAPKGVSIMQPLAGGIDSIRKGVVFSIKGTAKSQTPVNTEAFWRKRLEDVSVDEAFFHKYFNAKDGAKSASTGKKKTRDEGEIEDENEDEIWKALVSSRPEIEIDEDGDMGMDEFSEDDWGNEDESDVDKGHILKKVKKEVVGAQDHGNEESESDISFGQDDEGDVWSSDEVEIPSGMISETDDNGSTGIQAAFEKELEVANSLVKVSGTGLKSKSKKHKKDDGKKGKKEKKTAKRGMNDNKADDESDSNRKKNKKRKLRHLPTFASADDYSHLLGLD